MGGRLCMAFAVVALTVGGTASCFRLPPPVPPPSAPSVAATVPPATPAVVAAPARPPEYVGVVEQVKVYPRSAPAGRPVVWVLVRYTQSGRPPELVWAHLDDAVLEQNGAHLEPGAAIRVWAPGDVAETDPGQVWAEYVLCELAGK